MSNQNDLVNGNSEQATSPVSNAEPTQPVQFVDENGNPIEFVDENGNPVDLIDEDGNPIEYVDEDGNPISFEMLTGQPTPGTASPVDQDSADSATTQLEASDLSGEFATQKIPAYSDSDALLGSTPVVGGTNTDTAPISTAGVAPAETVDAQPTVMAPLEMSAGVDDDSFSAQNEADLSVRRESILPPRDAEEPASTAQEAAEFSVNNEELESTATRRSAFLNSQPTVAEEPAEEESAPKWRVPSEAEGEAMVKADLRALTLEDAMLDGATVEPSVPSRVASHLWVLLLSILAIPTSWYLLSDVATRLRNPDLSPWLSGSGVNAGIITEMVFALVCLFLVVWAARFSSIGTFLMGLVATVAGAPFVFAPGMMKSAVTPMLKALQTAAEGNHFYQALPANLAHHIEVTGSNGMLLATGIALLGLGFVSHGARRKGRRDYLIDEKVKSKKRRKEVLAD